ncbi:MAG: SUMF1/EgtB/PvdO family nonheme iron enzyme [Planctomycetes bacterium]|nr:SUMF1/EgtB/PvdO family nonheme iron enzyme [Planctomycetota bacterium]
MTSSTRVLELLVRWQELHEQGDSITPEELCRECPELAEEVKKRLEGLGQLAAFMGSQITVSQARPLPQTETLAESGKSTDARISPRDAVTNISGYEILGELGRGGMGVVYKARQLRLNRIVALKMILAGGHAGPAELERFRIESESVAQLQHPNIVQIHEIADHDGLPYFSLEFCPQGSLARKLSGTPLPPAEAARLVETLAHGVEAAHQKNIIHRDLKPANVLLAEDGTPKITDFGLAKKLEDEDYTATGAVLGTPSYMAPEQAAGKTKEIGPAADIYALGAILYECLTGRPPFKGATKFETIQQALAEDPVPPSRLVLKLPRDLETICLKCLNKEPGQRYGSADALAKDLARFLAGEPILARPTSAFERALKWVRRRPVTAALSAAVVLVSALGLAAGVAIRVQAVEQKNATHAAGLVQRLLSVDTPLVPGVLNEMAEYRHWANPQLRQEFEQAAANSRPKLHASLALLQVDDGQADYLYERFLDAWPQEVAVIRDALASHKEKYVAKLWSVVEQPVKGKESQGLRAACALAAYDPDDSRWNKISGSVVEQLIADPVNLSFWIEGLRLVRIKLLPRLVGIFKNRQEGRTAERSLATNILADYAANEPEVLADLLMDAEAKEFGLLYPFLAKHGDRALAFLRAELDKKRAAQAVSAKDVFKKKDAISADDPKVTAAGGLAMSAKVFEVAMQADATYRIGMSSKEVDSFLVVQDSSGKELASDDDSGGYLDSLLEFRPPKTDSYKVWAAALPNAQTKASGAFVLTITEVAAPSPKQNVASRQANAAVALLRMNQSAEIWPLLKHSLDPSVRSWLIHRLGPQGLDAGAIIKQLDDEEDVTAKRALILSLGEFGEAGLSPDQRQALTTKLQGIYLTAADPGLHAASEWLLRKWEQLTWLKQVNEEWANNKEQREKRLEGIKKQLASPKASASAPREPLALGADATRLAQWYVNGQGQTMVVIPGSVEFVMGSPPTEEGREVDEGQHKSMIGRTFALAATSVTLEQYRRFEKGYQLPLKFTRTADLPVVGIDWYRAAKYCNWLSEQEGIAEDQWCYETQGQMTKLRANYLSLTGYRLPTEAEMEFATRAGALTARYYGETEELLSYYAWYQKNSQDQTWPVAILKPNEFGLFDVLGNACTWCQESFHQYLGVKGDQAVEDKEDILTVSPTALRVMRGGAYRALGSVVRSASRFGQTPRDRSAAWSIRPARTLPLAATGVENDR